jgi:ketosteroid isomerase-like protein
MKIDSALQLLIDATNRGDSKAMLEAFTDDAVLIDFGRVFHGRSGIAQWDRNENIGTQNHLEITAVRHMPKSTELAITVSGNGFNGTGHFLCNLKDGLISRLIITS